MISQFFFWHLSSPWWSFKPTKIQNRVRSCVETLEFSNWTTEIFDFRELFTGCWILTCTITFFTKISYNSSDWSKCGECKTIRVLVNWNGTLKIKFGEEMWTDSLLSICCNIRSLKINLSSITSFTIGRQGFSKCTRFRLLRWHPIQCKNEKECH